MDKVKAWLKGLPDRLDRGEQGQSIIIIAAAMIGLIAFVGIVTDVAMVYVQYGHLRRAVDSAAVSAAGQMREGRQMLDIQSAARQTIALHNLEPGEVDIFVPPYLAGDAHYYAICAWAENDNNLDWWDQYHQQYWDNWDDPTNPAPPNPPEALPEDIIRGEDPNLCVDPPRKLVRVEAKARLGLAFLNIIGFHEVVLGAMSEGEAATLDVVLLLDRSWSMAWDSCPDPNPPEVGGDPVGCTTITKNCNLDMPNSCEPMSSVLDASRRFIDRLQAPFDRVSIVTFDQLAQVVVPMTSTLTYALEVLDGNIPAKNITIFSDEVDCRFDLCDESHPTYLDPCRALSDNQPWVWPCTNTNLGLGLGYANNQLTNWQTRRDESVWVMVVLSDGGANAALGAVESADCGTKPTDGLCCPPGTRDPGPYCRDDLSATRHCMAPNIDDCHPGGLDDPADWPADWSYHLDTAPPIYDADDFAKDMADFASLRPPYGNLIVTFAIGLGDDVIDYGGGGDVDAGEQALRYLANVGYNGQYDTGTGDLCSGAPVGASCGNYYFAPDTAGLTQIFSEIASRIFTRITQ